MAEFKPGQSGNPSGSRKGALNKATLATQALLVGDIMLFNIQVFIQKQLIYAPKYC